MMIYLPIVIILLAIYAYLFMHQPKFGGVPKNERLEKIKNSPDYKNGAFQNREQTPQMTNGATPFKIIKKLFSNETKNVKPRSPLPTIKTDLTSINREEEILIWFGHSSYYFQIAGKRFLVDPVFSKNASPIGFTNKAFKGTTIYHASDFPEIDYLIITHDHWDHLDYKTIVSLRNKIGKIICPLGVGAHFERWKYDSSLIIEKSWDETFELEKDLTISTVTTRHFSGRSFKRNQTLWSSFILQTPKLKLFLGCDSGYGNHFQEIANKFAPFDLAILENGQYNSFWQHIHSFPEETVKIIQTIQAKRVLPVHSCKFALSSHPWDEALRKLSSLCEQNKINLLTPKIGEKISYTDNVIKTEHWWEKLEK